MAWRITTWWKRTYEGLRGLVSLSFANFPGSGVVVWCLLVGVCLGFVFFCCFLASRETSALN